MNAFTTLILFVAAALTGILTGASLDQSIKQLPARHKMGVVAFSMYAQAADLGNGIVWYAMLGVGAALFTLIAAIMIVLANGNNPNLQIASIGAGVLAILHTLATTQAAPLYLSQRKIANDALTLEKLFNRFEFWQTLRAILDTLNFIVLLYVIFLYLTAQT